jgi:hypothetical protein
LAAVPSGDVIDALAEKGAQMTEQHRGRDLRWTLDRSEQLSANVVRSDEVVKGGVQAEKIARLIGWAQLRLNVIEVETGIPASPPNPQAGDRVHGMRLVPDIRLARHPLREVLLGEQIEAAVPCAAPGLGRPNEIQHRLVLGLQQALHQTQSAIFDPEKDEVGLEHTEILASGQAWSACPTKDVMRHRQPISLDAILHAC